MVYSDDFSSFETQLMNILYRIFSSISFTPYISLLLVYFLGKTKDNFTMVINIQLCISCMMHSASYLFPSLATSENGSPLCIIQALLNSLSDLCSINIATATLIISHLNFTNPILIETKKTFYLLLICILCWLLPLVICIVIFIYGEVGSNGNSFCWVNNYTVSFVYYGICFLNYIAFFISLNKIIIGIKIILKQTKSMDMYDTYISVFVKFTSVVGLTFCIFSINFGVTVTGYLNIALPGQIYFGIALLTQLGELISCPLYVILYGFNATRFKELQSILCFKKSDNQYTEDIQLEVQKAIKEVDDNNNNMD